MTNNTVRDYTVMDDEKLLFLIGNSRDRFALTELYTRYKHAVGAFLQRSTFQAKLVEEIYNDVMLTVWQKASGFRGESKVSTWIFAIAYRQRLTHVRKESRHTQMHTDNLPNEVPDDSKESLNETIRAAISELSDQHRTVIDLAYFHGYSISEIAAIVDRPQNTVKTRLFYARQNLKATIEADQLSLESD